ncbi:meiotic recombination protein REC8 homolog [Eleutherodactylus coqui]|uniref:meiotic recombination protein REC8 homolog n=1 Tax=Eleutherodactylus coqui TaxID=57060 RepID=UPI0034627A79
MFYYPNVLQRHTGCFSTVWLAATKGSKIVKREYLKVNVIITCQKIVQYVLQQVPPPYPGSPIPRLSLYLSAQLSYGVVCVYHRQCDLLIDEVKTTLERLYKAEKLAKIDLLHTEQHLLLPDNLILMQMLEDAPNPFFGLMEIPPELPEPTMIPQLSVLLETSGPEIVRLEKTPPRHTRGRHAADTSHLTSPELITIREVEPAPLPIIEFDQDLPEVSALDLELLMSDLPSILEVETLPETGKRRPKEIKDVKEVKPKEPKRERETEEEKHLEELAVEAESIKRELQARETEVTHLKEERRQTELQHECERERQRKEEMERENSYKQEVKREMERLQKARRELKRLQSTGAAEELLLEKQEEINHQKKLQKEKQHQWEAEKHEQQLKVEQREREYLKEREQVMQRLREAEQEIERLKRAMAEQPLDERGLEPAEKMRKIEERVDEKYKSETEGSLVRSPTKSRLPSEVLSELDAAALLDEATGQQDLFPGGAFSPVPVPPTSSPQLMLPEVPLEGRARPAVRRAMRKTTLIVDKDTQIGRKAMQEQTRDPHISTRPVVAVTIPSVKPQTPASMFESPTYQEFMAPELRELWSRCALSGPLQYIQEREEEFISEMEEVRAATESGVSMMVPSEFSLELSEEERSRPSILVPEERRSFTAQEDRVLPMVSEMPELIVELPETEEVVLSDIQRKLRSEMESAARSEFLGLTPRSSSRLLVSRFFFSCLGLCTQQVIRLKQTEPYGQIDITPGRNYPQD